MNTWPVLRSYVDYGYLQCILVQRLKLLWDNQSCCGPYVDCSTFTYVSRCTWAVGYS